MKTASLGAVVVAMLTAGACGQTPVVGTPPQVALSAPAGDITLPLGAHVQIVYMATDADAGQSAVTDLVAVPEGAQPYELASALPDTGGEASTYDWDTSGMATGTYRIEARTTSGGETVVAVAPGRVTIQATDLRLGGPPTSWIGGAGNEIVAAIDTFPDGSFCAVGAHESAVTVSIGEPSEETLASAAISEAWVARYDESGGLLWAFSTESGEDGWGVDIAALHGDGSCVIAGVFHGELTLDPGGPSETGVASSLGTSYSGFLARVAEDGSVLWTTTLFGTDGSGVDTDVAVLSMARLDDDSFIVTGSFFGDLHYRGPDGSVRTYGSPGSQSMFVTRIDRDGGPRWWSFAASSASDIRPRGVDVFPDGACIVTGDFESNLTFQPGLPSQTTLSAGNLDFDRKMFLARFDRDGDVVWARLEGDLNQQASGESLATFADGSFGAVGVAYDDVTLGSDQPNETTLPLTDSDYFLARYEADGRLRWALRVPHIGYFREVFATDQIVALGTGDLAYVGGVNHPYVFDDGADGTDVNPDGLIQTVVLHFDANGRLERYDADGYSIPGEEGGSIGMTIASMNGEDVLVGGIFAGVTAFEVDLGPALVELASRDQFDAFIQRMIAED